MTGHYAPDPKTAPTRAFPSIQGDGMTLRQWYAGQALAGAMANEALMKQLVNSALTNGFPHLSVVAQLCWEQADAMIAAEKGDA